MISLVKNSASGRVICDKGLQRTLARTKTTGADYQFLQRTTVPMLHFQPSLPRLPIPKLENTCDRYLSSLKPLLSDADFAKSSALVKDFQQGVGPQLQTLLQAHDKANKQTSYISAPWFDMYLSDRQPLPINYNPLLIMTPHDKAALNNQRLQASNFVISSLRFMRSLRAQQLGPEVFHLNPKESDTDKYRRIMRLTPSAISTYVSYIFKAYPLDMSQYQGLFGATRIPEKGKDRIYRNTDSRHILVIKGGNIYTVDVLDKDGNIEEPSVINDSLGAVFDSNAPENEFALGHLTSENRDTWAGLRNHLLSLEGNEQKMNAVDSALFAVCLDDKAAYDDNNPVDLIREGLFDSTANRWFDKSFSLLIAKDGTTSVNFEHSWGDGVAVMRYCNDVCQDVKKNPYISDASSADPSKAGESVKKIDFTLDDRMKEGIRQAKANHKAITDDLEMGVFRQYGMGKKTCKVNKVSPDSIMQLGMQLAYYKQFGKFVSTYESCSTAAFRHGRTETMRPCTSQTKEFCVQVETKKSASKAELRELIGQCSTYHGELTKNAAMGQGFDRHLFGLRHTAEQNGLPKPELYNDPAYAMINYNVMSTSTLSSPNIVAGAFGPVVADGFGLAYGIMEDNLGVVVSSYKKHQKNGQFVDALKDSYKVIEDVLTN